MNVRSLGIVGGGWAGLATAIAAIDAGIDHVEIFEMAPQWGGRARAASNMHFDLDCGQHIMIGAYTESLRLMKQVGVKTTLQLLRTPLKLVYPDQKGLKLKNGWAPLCPSHQHSTIRRVPGRRQPLSCQSLP